MFLCVHNAGRSQMAAGWLNHLAGIASTSSPAARNPPATVNPAAVEAMAEVGIDIRAEFPKPWTDEIVRAADVVVTMGCGDACPLTRASATRTGCSTTPRASASPGVRPIRDEIRGRVEKLVAEMGIAPE